LVLKSTTRMRSGATTSRSTRPDTGGRPGAEPATAASARDPGPNTAAKAGSWSTPSAASKMSSRCSPVRPSCLSGMRGRRSPSAPRGDRAGAPAACGSARPCDSGRATLLGQRRGRRTSRMGHAGGRGEVDRPLRRRRLSGPSRNFDRSLLGARAGEQGHGIRSIAKHAPSTSRTPEAMSAWLMALRP
jgi:hypothetical protein